MLLNSGLIVIIDGNNLAHFLYNNLPPETKMADKMTVLLVNHLDSYARAYPDQVNIELVLDKAPERWINIQSKNLRLVHSAHPQKADDVILGQFLLYHQINRLPCVVITNDQELLDEIQSGGGAFLRCSDFVRRPGRVNPVFTEPNALPKAAPPPRQNQETAVSHPLRTSIFYRVAREQNKKVRPTKGLLPVKRQEVKPEADFSPLVAAEKASQVPRIPNDTELLIEIINPPNQPNAQPQDSGSGLTYAINFDDWPLQEGARFLRRAFCETHRVEYQDLLKSVDYRALQPADLRAIAELLRYACGQEPGFARQGSFADRVRLALINAHSSRVTLAEIAQRADLPLPGLHRKIKTKVSRWVQIFPEHDERT